MSDSKQGTLILVRHGASVYNIKNIFTGWIDADIAPKGTKEAHRAAKKLKGLIFDIAYTSVLKRAMKTLDIILNDLQQTKIPIRKDKALNERHYGDLQGKNKTKVAQEMGEKLVHLWRRSFDVAPPSGESLKDTCKRTHPYFAKYILPKVKAGKTVLVVAHGNSLRSIAMDLDRLSPQEVVKFEIPTGIPFVYKINSKGKIISKKILCD